MILNHSRGSVVSLSFAAGLSVLALSGLAVPASYAADDPPLSISDSAAVQGDQAGPEIAAEVTELRDLGALRLTPGQLRTIVQHLSRLDAAEKTYTAREQDATRSVLLPLRRVRAALLNGEVPSPRDQEQINTFLSPVQAEKSRLESLKNEVIRAIAQQLTRPQMNHIRTALHISTAPRDIPAGAPDNAGQYGVWALTGAPQQEPPGQYVQVQTKALDMIDTGTVPAPPAGPYLPAAGIPTAGTTALPLLPKAATAPDVVNLIAAPGPRDDLFRLRPRTPQPEAAAGPQPPATRAPAGVPLTAEPIFTGSADGGELVPFNGIADPNSTADGQKKEVVPILLDGALPVPVGAAKAPQKPDAGLPERTGLEVIQEQEGVQTLRTLPEVGQPLAPPPNTGRALIQKLDGEIGRQEFSVQGSSNPDDDAVRQFFLRRNVLRFLRTWAAL